VFSEIRTGLYAHARTDDTDVLWGNRGNDRLLANDQDNRDTLNGGPGTDTCYGDAGDNFRRCEVINP
jgi:Ca2+-binding RTX toxin-like protein